MKIRRLILTLAGAAILTVGAISGIASPAGSPKDTAKAGKTIESVTHGTVATSSSGELTLTAKKGAQPETFKLDSSTAETGTPAPGAKVTVHYKMDNGQKVATRLIVSGAKAVKTASSAPRS